MNRRTKQYQVALDRLVEHLGLTLEDCPKKSTWVQVDLRPRVTQDVGEWLLNSFHLKGNRKTILAELVRWATEDPPVGWGMTEAEVRDVLRLTEVDRYGIKGHHYGTLRRVLL